MPLAPISTGLRAVISSGTFVAMVLDLDMFCLVCVERGLWMKRGGFGSCLGEVASSLGHVFYWVSHGFFTFLSLSKIKSNKLFLVGGLDGVVISFMCLQLKHLNLLTTVLSFAKFLGVT